MSTVRCYVCHSDEEETKESVIIKDEYTCNRCELLLFKVRHEAIQETADLFNKGARQ